MPVTEKKQVTVYLPDILVAAFRHRLVDERKSMTTWMEESVRRYLAEEPTCHHSLSDTVHSPGK